MAEPYLAPHPWDALGKPPEPGKPYVEPEPDPSAIKATATFDGFSDTKGRRMDFEHGVEVAARYIRDHGDVFTIERLVRESLAPDDILEWLIDPDTGLFDDRDLA